ncbi:Ras GTPase activating protein ira2 [Puccinia graminis f. sp. tritici]|uniref:Ras GTPase activating protein ira2 n=1 Tax=Puccinia graminis f. sp. tritici TaxID=56615 RepID=A0A5B0PJ95_PUCGR|nr:Ras GTPase activating protein ira2 [Puccinia graminis f. sp. tritici]
MMMIKTEQAGNGPTPELAAALQRELSSITREIVELAGFREQTMNCLVKLMATNMNPAFRYFVNMFHHPDTRVKQANIQILWEVIKEGSHLLPELVRPVRTSGLDKIVNVGSFFTTRLLTIFARAQGYDYLRNTLSNLLVGLSNKPSEFSVDFNPHRASANDDEASRNLEQVTEAFLNVTAVSWRKLPSAIREICHHIATTVQEKYPDSVFTSIRGFIFLRFINPAIISPEVINLDLPNDTREIRRSLVMITKVLQALSNNIRFSAREPALKPLNPFMAKKVYPMTRFLKDISLIDEHGMMEEGTELNDELALVPLDAADQYVLHQFLYEDMDKLGAELKSARANEFKHWHDGTERLTPTLGQEIWAEVHQTLLEIGPPGAADPDLPMSQFDSPEYHAFLAKFELSEAPDPRIWQYIRKLGATKKQERRWTDLVIPNRASLSGLVKSLYQMTLKLHQHLKSYQLKDYQPSQPQVTPSSESIFNTRSNVPNRNPRIVLKTSAEGSSRSSWSAMTSVNNSVSGSPIAIRRGSTTNVSRLDNVAYAPKSTQPTNLKGRPPTTLGAASKKLIPSTSRSPENMFSSHAKPPNSLANLVKFTSNTGSSDRAQSDDLSLFEEDPLQYLGDFEGLDMDEATPVKRAANPLQLPFDPKSSPNSPHRILAQPHPSILYP